ncbi:MAG: biotin transporter BioY, partial [Beijerinckiaceae bacterium]
FLAGLVMAHMQLRNAFVRALCAAVAGGILVVYACGNPWLALAANMQISAAALAALVFVPGDILKAIAAAAVVASLPPKHLHAARI